MALVRRSDRHGAAKKYPPLGIAMLAIVGLLASLPSALNLPQSNPAETLEYAPVPPEGDQLTAPTGNLSSLGLGASQSVGGGPISDELGPASPGEVPGGRALKTAGTKRCVGDPPRQTEDPLSPPCVASFTGDNGGATYQGVSGDEIRYLFAFDGGEDCGIGCSSSPPVSVGPNTYFDLFDPLPDDPSEEPYQVRSLRVWQRYFNDRYQTYGRAAHFFVFFGSQSATPETRRAQAVENFEKVKPFGVTPGFIYGNTSAYTEVMARRGVFVFSNGSLVPAEEFSRFAPLLWNVDPSLEKFARTYGTYVCQKVAGQPVSISGNPAENGRPRVYGLVYPDSDSYPQFKDEVKRQIKACGVSLVSEQDFPCSFCVFYTGEDPGYAARIMADFREKGVTTILWAGGYETGLSQAAGASGYLPEWIIAGDWLMQGSINGRSQNQAVFDRHTTLVSTDVVLEQSGVTRPCEQAYKEGGGEDDIERANACNVFYDTLRLLFTGIQVAGPRLTPPTMDKGYHAIPGNPSSSPEVPACFFDPGDYTCVKDASVMWWDASAAASDGQGCWRFAENGKRYISGQWPDGNVEAQRGPQDVCNTFLGGGGAA